MDRAGQRQGSVFLIGLAALYALALALAPAISDSSDLFPLWVAGRLYGTPEADHIYVSLARGLVVNDPAWLALAREAGMREITAYVQPPWVAALVAPLAKAASFRAFAGVCLALNIAALLAAGSLALARWAPRLGAGARLAVLFALLASGPGIALMHYNQTQCLVLLGLVAGLSYAEARPRSAGLALGIVAAIKLTPILIALYWLISRRNRAGLVALATVAVVARLDLALVAPDLNAAFVDSLRGLAGSLNLAGSNQAPVKLVYAWLDPAAVGPLAVNVGRTIPLPTGAGIALNALALGATLLIGWWARSRAATDRADCDALMLLATVPFAPIAWNHYYAAVLLAAIVILGRGGRTAGLVYASVLALLSLGTYALADRTGLTLAALSNAAALLTALALLAKPASWAARGPAATLEAAR